MRKTSLIARLALGLLVLVFALASCADDGATVAKSANTAVVIGAGTTPNSNTKGLVADYGRLTETDYFWFYKTTVTNYEGTPAYKGEQTAWPTDPEHSKGLNGGIVYSLGDWTLELWAYTSASDDFASGEGLAYYGKANFTVSVDRVSGNVVTTTDFYNADGTEGYKVYVPMQYVDLENNDDNIPFTGENGTIDYAFDAVVMSLKDDNPKHEYYVGQDGVYDWFKYSTITDLKTGDSVWDYESDYFQDVDNETSYTSYSGAPSSYQIETLYDSLGVFYKLVDTVDIHSNKTVKVTGSFETRSNKTFVVYLHDGKIFNADGTVNTDSSIGFTGKLDALNAHSSGTTWELADYTTDTDGSASETVTVSIPSAVYTFEDEMFLPYLETTTDTTFKDGYGFWGWFLTDTDWHVTDTNYADVEGNDLESRVRNDVSVYDIWDGHNTTQSIYVATAAEDDFEAAYGLCITQTDVRDKNTSYSGLWESSEYVYEIHLYARWVELTKTVGAYTTNLDYIDLYDAENGMFNAKTGYGDGYVHYTIVEGEDHIQGFTSFADFTYYTIDSDPNQKKYRSTTDAAFTAGTAYTEHYIIGFCVGDTSTLLLTNEGILVRESTGVEDYIQLVTVEGGLTKGVWKSQGGSRLICNAKWGSKSATI